MFLKMLVSALCLMMVGLVQAGTDSSKILKKLEDSLMGQVELMGEVRTKVQRREAEAKSIERHTKLLAFETTLVQQISLTGMTAITVNSMRPALKLSERETVETLLSMMRNIVSQRDNELRQIVKSGKDLGQIIQPEYSMKYVEALEENFAEKY